VHSLVLWSGLATIGWRGLPWVALAVTLATAASTTAAFWCALGILRLGVSAVLEALWAPIAAATVMAVAVLAVRQIGLPSGVATVCVAVAVGAVTYVAALAVCAPGDARELATTFGLAEAGARLRPSLRSRVG
jgi:hypothetical protein